MDEYIDWCPKNLSGEGKNEVGKVPEENAWRIMLCIFKCLLVLERGEEEADEDPLPLERPWDDTIAHFDIKPENSKLQEMSIRAFS